MSIIEKAAGRLERDNGGKIPQYNAQNQGGADQFMQSSRRNQGKESTKQVEIDLAKMHRLGMVTPDQGATLAKNEFSGIKRAILQNVMAQRSQQATHSNLIMLTSSLPGEGKTFCAINLAMSLAIELDHTVLLVDADVARPSVLRTLGLKSELGIMDLLLDEELDMADVMLKTNVESLSILPAGSSHIHATELLASMAMNKLLNDISNRYSDRIVIFDSPPLLLTNEAHVLARQMGQIVMVVAAENTKQQDVKNALRLIESNSQISLIYNKAEPFLSGNKYGYGYNS
jgi:exopolysaccharide/PEP-CTERM locus tyrosine autokinase